MKIAPGTDRLLCPMHLMYWYSHSKLIHLDPVLP